MVCEAVFGHTREGGGEDRGFGGWVGWWRRVVVAVVEGGEAVSVLGLVDGETGGGEGQGTGGAEGKSHADG